MRKILAFTLVISLILSLAVPAMAQNEATAEEPADIVNVVEDETLEQEEPEGGEEKEVEEEDGKETEEEETDKEPEEEEEQEEEELDEEEEEVSPSNPSVDLEVIAALELEITADGFFLTADGMAFAEWLEYNEFSAIEFTTDMTVSVNEINEYGYEEFLIYGELSETGEIVFYELEDGFGLGEYILIIENQVYSVAAYYFGEEVRLSFAVEGPMMVRAFDSGEAVVETLKEFQDALADEDVTTIVVDGHIHFPMMGAPVVRRELSIVGGSNGGKLTSVFGFVIRAEGAELSLADITIDASDLTVGSIAVEIVDGTLNILDGTHITGVTSSANGEYSAGVLAHNSTVNMLGGEISGNVRGISVRDGSSFTMSGGVIENNIFPATSLPQVFSVSGAGVNVFQNASFTLDGGVITNNTTLNGSGGGVYVGHSSSTFDFVSGTISVNEARRNNTNTALGHGGGVAVDIGGVFTMSGGHITDNNAFGRNNSHEGNGGGVFIASNGSFTLSDGFIDDNKAFSNGGGVFIAADATFNMDGGEISENTVINGNGGGVRVIGEFNMSDGVIEGNRAGTQGQTNMGGGVQVAPTGGIFNMSGGSIKNNTALNHGGAVHVGRSGTGGITAKNSAVLNMTGGEILNGSANIGPGVYVAGGSFVIDGEETLVNSIEVTNSGFLHLIDGTVLGAGSRDRVRVNFDGAFVMDGGLIENGAVEISTSWVNTAGDTVFDFNGGLIKNSSVSISSTGEHDGHNYRAIINMYDDAVMSGTSISFQRGTFNMYGGVIKGLNAGHVVNINMGTFNMHEGASITGNNVSEVIYVNSSQRDSLPAGVVNMYGGSIDNNNVTGRGVVYLYRWANGSFGNESIFNMYNGTIHTNNITLSGSTRGMAGAVTVGSGGEFNMSGGLITGNESSLGGAGVALWPSLINGNGGTFIYDGGKLNMTGGQITNNTANSNGGGVFVGNGAELTFDGSNAFISDNNAVNGGGIYVQGGGKIDFVGASVNNPGDVHLDGGIVNLLNGSITENKATGNGGGIFSASYNYEVDALEAGDYAGIAIDENVKFSSNFAGEGAFRSPDITALSGRIADMTGSVSGQNLFNNYDINFRHGEPLEEFEVTVLEGGTGYAPAAPNNSFVKGDTVTLVPGTRAQHRFGGWVIDDETLPVGAIVNNTFTMPENNVTLRATWISNAPNEFTVTVLDGGTGFSPAAPNNSFAAGAEVTLVAGTKAGQVFDGWEISAGLDTISGNAFTMPGVDVTVTATWVDVAPGTGPGDSGPTDPTEPGPGTTDPTGPTSPEVNQAEPGGSDPAAAPTPTVETNVLVENEDGSFTEIDEAGVPLGSWNWDDEEEVWIFDEDVPLAAMMPRTGLESNAGVLGLGFLVSAIAAAFVIINIRRLKREEA